MCSNQWGVLEPENFEKEGTSWTDVVVEYLSSSVGTSGKPPRLAPAKGQAAHSLTDQSRLLEGLVAWDFQKGGNVLSKVPPMIARRWRAQAKASICLQVAVDHGYLGCNDLFTPPPPHNPHWLVRRRERETPFLKLQDTRTYTHGFGIVLEDIKAVSNPCKYYVESEGMD